MPDADEAAIAAAEDADFASGFPEKVPAKPPPAEGKPDAEAPAKPDPKATPAVPQFVQVTKKDWDEVRAAASRTASYEQQLSRLWGTTGELQKRLNQPRADGPGRKVEIPADAFAEMERDFPELAKLNKGALEKALAGISGPGGSEMDDSRFEALIAAREAKREIETLNDSYPDWRTIVGAVNIAETQPDANNPFRRWLATKDADYQQRLNASTSAAVIGRAIRLFQTETKGGRPGTPAAAAPTARDATRREQIRGAVQPRGDRAGAPAGPSDDEMFEAGFNSR